MSAIDHIGKMQFIWWQGTVEDVMDPMKAGRVRVRIIGYHNPDKDELPVQDLPWALPVMPVTSASVSGIGLSPTGLVPGSVVIGFFRDGPLGQQPIIFGSIPGIPLEVHQDHRLDMEIQDSYLKFLASICQTKRCLDMEVLLENTLQIRTLCRRNI